MLGTLIQLLVLGLILAVVFWVIQLILGHLGAPPFIAQILGVILILIFLLAILAAFGLTPAPMKFGALRLFPPGMAA